MNLEELARNWKPPDGLSYSGLRPVRLTRTGIALVAVVLALTIGGLAGGALMAARSRRETANREALDARGVSEQAVVVRLWRSGDKEHKPRLSYRFTVEGREMLASKSAPLSIWRSLEPGAILPIRYDPADFANSHPTAWDPEVTPWWLAWLLPLSVMPGPLAILWNLRRQWRLLAEGRPAPGIVTESKRGGRNASVRYDFRLMNGSVRSSRSALKSSKSLPPVGSAVCVLYDPENPRRSGRYPFPLVRLAS